MTHESVLAFSPVFAQMLSGPSREGMTTTITLPKDKPEAVGLLLECLYSHDHSIPPQILAHYRPPTISPDEVSFGSEILCQKLVELFIIADKYQLPTVQHSALQGLQKERLSSCNPSLFLCLAEQVYNNTEAVGSDFQKYLKSEVSHALDQMTSSDEKAYLASLLACGGELAADLFEVRCTDLTTSRSTGERNKAKFELLRTELQKTKAELKATKTELDNKTKTFVIPTSGGSSSKTLSDSFEVKLDQPTFGNLKEANPQGGGHGMIGHNDIHANKRRCQS